jgi:hypothetical protein
VLEGQVRARGAREMRVDMEIRYEFHTNQYSTANNWLETRTRSAPKCGTILRLIKEVPQ